MTPRKTIKPVKGWAIVDKLTGTIPVDLSRMGIYPLRAYAIQDLSGWVYANDNGFTPEPQIIPVLISPITTRRKKK